MKMGNSGKGNSQPFVMRMAGILDDRRGRKKARGRPGIEPGPPDYRSVQERADGESLEFCRDLTPILDFISGLPHLSPPAYMLPNVLVLPNLGTHAGLLGNGPLWIPTNLVSDGPDGLRGAFGPQTTSRSHDIDRQLLQFYLIP
ncbi:unnamed protein product [Darwinula stevensoni]|uniref:Uncharacterized protein n=1 Tax=Darwinula stevensoni TaxID=69355 RepID=A0A7R9AB32_9CRUS|nr:unnamed protein product [Darwinula stevensoni]CAG0898682.1 unnamed protein product [Darwinula stevensoni]